MSDREAKAVHLIDDIRNLIAEYDRGEPLVVRRLVHEPLPILREDVDDLYGGVAPAGRRVFEPDGTVTEPDREERLRKIEEAARAVVKRVDPDNAGDRGLCGLCVEYGVPPSVLALRAALGSER